MPRTKVVRKVKQENSKKDALIGMYIDQLDIFEQMKFRQLQIAYEASLFNLDRLVTKEMSQITRCQGELSTAMSTTMGNQTLTKSTRRLPRRTSKTNVDDEGYLTAESRSLSSERTATKPKPRARPSRSLSRTNTKPPPPKTGMKTPMNRKIPDVSVITPKCKMNTPQLVLRRPKQGEMAVSLQGSPLMVGSVTTDTECTVSIPFGDGLLCAIQPQRGPIRLSQLPPLDNNIQEQLQALRDNLNKICEAQMIGK